DPAAPSRRRVAPRLRLWDVALPAGQGHVVGAVARRAVAERAQHLSARHHEGSRQLQRVALEQPRHMPLEGSDEAAGHLARAEELGEGPLRSEERRVGKEWRARWWT